MPDRGRLLAHRRRNSTSLQIEITYYGEKRTALRRIHGGQFVMAKVKNISQMKYDGFKVFNVYTDIILIFFHTTVQYTELFTL